jgi:hypothetical protein
MESLQSAARAAGFAMATSDDGEEGRAPQLEQRAEWQPTQALLLPVGETAPPGKLADAVKGLWGFFGRRAPASPA